MPGAGMWFITCRWREAQRSPALQAAGLWGCLLWACNSMNIAVHDRLPQMCPAHMQVVQCVHPA